MALDLTRKGLEETRRSVLDLRAAPLEGRTLAAALSDLASEKKLIFDGSASSPKFPAAVEVGLYRIAQEAVQNALRHAEASRIVIRLETSSDKVRLTIEDDGQGFVIGQESSASRFGLVGMRERAHLLGGNFRIESSPGAGTRVTVEVGLR